jgi:hypothetical protein
MILQIVESAPGFPHGIIDPIEVSDLHTHYLLISQFIQIYQCSVSYNSQNIKIDFVGAW